MPIRRRQKKRNDEPRQKQKQRHAVIDPLVDPGNPPYRHQTRSKADPTRTHHRLVTVAQSSPSSRSALSPQKTATVMLGGMSIEGHRRPFGLSIWLGWHITARAVRSHRASFPRRRQIGARDDGPRTILANSQPPFPDRLVD